MKIDRQNRQFTPEYHPACGMPCQPFFHGTGSTPSGAGGHGGSRWRVPTIMDHFSDPPARAAGSPRNP
ncbi:MAG: hypothetical protein JRM78_04625 [Nitrososphaerota archaeon]|nr:hypothetical protein [Nitrososphaerota archaeon]